jgi:predicted phage terminase large subunit-like protein
MAHTPWPTQLEFLNLDAEEALFGGAAGGGKTDAAIMGALQYVDRPNYSAAIFRRQKADFSMPTSILERTRSWLQGTAAQWDEKMHGFRFPSGATLHFGWGRTLNDITTRYQGLEFHYLYFDELTQWPERLYLYLFSRTRKEAKSTIPVRVRAGTNPGGVGHQWVKRRFVENAKHVTKGTDVRTDIKMRKRGINLPTPRVYVSPPSTEAVALAKELGTKPQGAYFVPSFKEDNPALDITDYKSKLLRLQATERAQLDEGDWDAVASGGWFQHGWFHIIPAPPAGVQWVRSWDFASTENDGTNDPDWTAGGKMGMQQLENKEQRIVIAHMERFQEDAGETERRIKLTADIDGRRVPIIIEQEPGSAGKSEVRGYKTRVLVGYNVVAFPRSGDKMSYWKGVSSLASAGGIWLVEGAWNQELIDEFTGLPVGHDDQADCVAAGFDVLTGDTLRAQRLRAMAKL